MWEKFLTFLAIFGLRDEAEAVEEAVEDFVESVESIVAPLTDILTRLKNHAEIQVADAAETELAANEMISDANAMRAEADKAEQLVASLGRLLGTEQAA